jgi:uncharacterized membrane protein YtjA (UPF0391 family)
MTHKSAASWARDRIAVLCALDFDCNSLTRNNVHAGTTVSWESAMLRWALIFLVIALIAAVLGFGGIAAAAADIGRFLFGLFLILFIVSLIIHTVRRGP